MPRFSIIVPVYKVQGYLRTCLDSVLAQSFADFEVIAVDDCSPDHCGAIIDEYAARDARVRTVHLPTNVGLGRARNVGVRNATGDYLLFLDSDDSYTPGALAAIDERLAVTEDPDVLVFDHVLTYWWGRAGRSMTANMLAAAGTDTFDILTSPQYLDLFLAAWNKAYRREFFIGHGFAYKPGLYEDAPITYQVLVSARHIGCLDRVCVEYRQRRRGAIARTPGRKHFDIFAQYSSLFTFLDEHPELDAARPLLFERAINHFLTTLTATERVLPSDRADFYRMIVRFYRRYKPAGLAPPTDRYRLRWRLTATSPYAVFRAWALADSVRSAAARKRRELRSSATRRTKRTLTRIERRRPLDPHLAVYSAFSHRGVLGDPAAIQQAARTLAPHVRPVWVVRPEAVDQVPEGVDFVLPGTLRYHRVVSRATYFFNNVNWAAGLVKREGQIHVHTHLGTPLKHMGVDLLSRPAAMYHLNVAAQLRRSDRWDYSLVSSRHAQWAWDRAYPCRFTSLATGAPRNDVLVRGDALRAAAVRKHLRIPEGNTVVLYAPTPRDHSTWYKPRVDFERLVRELGSGVTLLVRLHRQDAHAAVRSLQLRDLEQHGLLRDVTDERCVEDLMLASDALVTDYSSLMFDYVHLDRPIVVHTDDWPAYQAARGTYFDLLATPPGHVTIRTGQLAHLFTSGAWRDERSATLRSDFRARFCEYDDGDAAARVVSLVMLGQDFPLSTSPQRTLGQRQTSPSFPLRNSTP
ncbi:bifunctional glycosyltransferase family 2 protein/CDP-glycerol:glycerophosphate glycerophosphotransferase [Streptomyces sp. NBC_01283]|uniref:bifunctional glycosyltransferase/CDP-glycerol:glycerophosphate glycerophosphotransferase n=1 Tax=Streptomyces sp. NBC_01283 TaxID=2903812 RepID=UPI00352F8F04|nr:bifunctional glycosyltransferase family 2 protein/CDP-glycerol:glycerophosphate glycerophosphotransferase [Streptomyces sp. NBC_01283]